MNNEMAIRLAGSNSAYGRKERDFYPTPPEVTQALLDFLNLDQKTVIWEPACGEGHMTQVMRDNGYQVIGTDIITGTDYLTASIPECDWIITNPPFSVSEGFIRRSIQHGKPFALLLKSQYWHAKRRYELFGEHRPRYILPLTWRPDFLFGKRGGSSLIEILWTVWTGKADTTEYIPLKKPETDK